MRASTWAKSCLSPRYVCHRALAKSTGSHSSSNFGRRDFHNTKSRFISTREAADQPKTNSSELENTNGAQAENLGEQEPHPNFDGPSNGSNNGTGSSKPKDPTNYGSASNRARRNRLPKELPPVHIPDWFLERNVTLAEDLEKVFETFEISPPLSEENAVSDENPGQTESSSKPKQEHGGANFSKNPAASTTATTAANDPAATEASASRKASSQANTTQRMIFKRFPKKNSLSWVLKVPGGVMHEMMLMLGAMMVLPHPRYVDVALSNKGHMLLCCPRNGASRFLIQLMQEWSFSGASFDYLRLDAQDIAEIGGSYMEDLRIFESGTLSSLGYDVFSPPIHGQESGSEHLGQGEDFDETDEGDIRGDDKSPSTSQPYAKSNYQRKGSDIGMGIISLGNLAGDLREVFRSLANYESNKSPSPSTSAPYVMQASREFKDSTQDLKIGLLVETLLNAPEKKIKAKEYTQPLRRPPPTMVESEAETDEKSIPESNSDPRPVSKNFIIFIEDYLHINATLHGSRFLDKLYEVVAVKRSEGKRVIVIGISSSKEMMPTYSKSSVDELQAGSSTAPMRTIVVPVTESTNKQVLIREHKQRIRNINLRHLRDMIRRLAPAPEQRSTRLDDWNMEIDSKTTFLTDLEESVWSIDRVNRVALHTLGFLVAEKRLQVPHLEAALTGIHESDQAKYKWVKEEKEMERKTHEKPQKRESDAGERIRKLREKCNKHEQRLLTGVIDADSIRTTFADIRAPQETIDALKTLTSLSLARPDAFTYGVLATDRIPGLLLYGPPGTGKTLLAKAVAKESASTMLEVSGSDIYNMYVGESEKNVRAIFSLARKLAPCVVFIDEADAILGSRSSHSTRVSHRDLINQFLREWDGMTDLNAFIMVATNRPFDLDEASLRRLPRRLLVDLPVEKDREEILKIHLKGETLDPAVSLSKLASETPFYSGSDLKNLCVAAALSCVREEFNAAAEHNNKILKDAPDAEKYKYADKRTLCVRHFSRGMDEISASISEDMSSLSAIRKFDEKYGDRKGRRKKLGAYGFKTVEESDAKGSDALRVRNQ